MCIFNPETCGTIIEGRTMERLELNQARNFVASMNFLQLLCFILVGAVVLDPDRQ